MIVLNYPQGSQDWLQARCGVITASRFSDAISTTGGLTQQQQTYVNAIKAGKSEASAMLAAGYKAAPRAEAVDMALSGVDPSKPSEKAIKYAWLIAMETISREPLDDTFVTYAMTRGRELEPRARSVYEHRTGAWIEEVSLILTDDSRFGYSADGFRDNDGLIEIKCPLAADKVGEVWQHPETAHLEYIDQINGGLWITGRKYCDLIVYCPWLAPVGKDLFVKRIHRDESAIEELESRLVRFMRIVDGFLVDLRTPKKMSGAPKDGAEAAMPPEPPPWEAPAARATAPALKPAPVDLDAITF
ncbi:lambda exonuclease family protein [Nostoc sp. NIES-2111]